LIVAPAADADDPAAIVQARVGHFKEIGRAAHIVQGEVAKSAPDATAIGDAARKIEGLAGQIPSWFPPGSGPDAGVTTQARAEIWSDPAGFRAKAAGLAASAQALGRAAASGEPAGMKSGFADLAQACQSCHATFRTREH